MKEKDLIKQVTDLNMPDFEKVRRNVTSSKKDNSKSFIARKFVYVVACCIFILSALAIPNIINHQGSKIQNIAEDLAEDSKNNLPNKDIVEKYLVFNSLEESSVDDYASSKIYIDPDKIYRKELTVDEVSSHLGINILSLKLPDGLKGHIDIYPDSKFTAIYNKDDTIAHDKFVFIYSEEFQKEKYNPLEKEFRVYVSKQGYLMDYVILFDDEMEKSMLDGQELLLGKRKMDYGPYTPVENGPNIPAGYYDVFLAKFIMNEIYFEIVADNFTEEEFIEALESIIQ